MSQDRLTYIAFLSIERDKFNSIDYDMIVDEFAEEKSRESIFW